MDSPRRRSSWAQPRKGENLYARVAIYRITAGTGQEIARKVDDEGGLRGIFRARPGFHFYELVVTNELLISVSRWDSAEQAEAARDTARSWVAEHLARAIALEHDYVGELALSSASPATGP